MKPPLFAYHAPETLQEAIALLTQYGGEAKVLAGGQSLVPLLNFRLARPTALIDINNIAELDYVREHDGVLEIGALTRHRTVERSSLVRERYPLLVEAVRHIGHFQIRNRGTVGGSIAHADPAAELPLVITTLEGEVVIAGPDGARTATPSEFFITLLTTSLATDEIVTAVRFPILPAGAGWAFRELSRRSGDFFLAAVTVALTLDGLGRIDWIRIGLGGVDMTSVRAPGAEALLLGRAPEPGVLAAAAAQVKSEIYPDSDLHGTAEYRRDVAALLTREALAEAADRAQRGGTAE